MDTISLIILVVVILMAYRFKINPGILGVGAAFILGFFLFEPTASGTMVAFSSSIVKAKTVLAGWNSSLFIILTGVSFLFSMARENGTLSAITGRAIYLTKGNKKLLPVVFFALALFVSAVGPGSLATGVLLYPICGALAFKEKMNPLILMLAVHAGVSCGGTSPLAPTGIIGINVAAANGVDIGYSIFYNLVVGFAILFVAIYLAFGGPKLQPMDETVEFEKQEPLNRAQIATLTVIGLMIAAVIWGKLDVGLCAFAASGILLVLKAADEKASFAGVPWNTFIMVCGMGVLVNIVILAGGIAYLTEVLRNIMTGGTAAPIFVVISVLLGCVSSASGVVLPTLIPAAIQMAAKLGIDANPLVVAVSYGAHLAAPSPFNPAGAWMLIFADSSIDKSKMFLHLIYVVIGSTVLGALVMAVKVVGYLI